MNTVTPHAGYSVWNAVPVSPAKLYIRWDVVAAWLILAVCLAGFWCGVIWYLGRFVCD